MAPWIPRLTAGAALGLAAFGTGAAAQPAAPPVRAWIAAEPSGTGQAFTGFVQAGAPFSGRYELVAERSGPAGRTTSRQSGTVDGGGDVPLQLSRTQLAPLGPADDWSVTLTVYRGEELVARDQKRR